MNILKSESTVRICGDFSATVNKFLDPVHTPLPSIDEVIGQVGIAKIFSKVDLSNAFLQLPLDENSKQFTTINTSEGLFTYNKLPLGLSASPGIFQAFMCKLLNDIDDVIVYQDDLLLMSRSIDEHNKTLHNLLSILKKEGIKLNMKKCQFFTDSVQYLGHIFDQQGVHPNPEKVRAIINAPAHSDMKQLQSFLGLCNFYNRFIRSFSIVLNPLYKLLRKEVKFCWGPEQQKSFESVKSLFTSSKVLKLFNPSYETLLETDSSGYGIAAVLMQRTNESCSWHPVQFASRTLNVAERNYSNIEREALSVIFGCDRFRKYLLGGAKFIIRNDQQPLRKLFAHDAGVPTTCSARLQRWALKLSQFNYKFEYSKGISNVNSDCLSRLPLPDTVQNSEPYELVFTVKTLDKLIISSEIQKQTDLDGDLVKLKHYIKYGCPIKIDKNLSLYKNLIGRMSILNGCILYGNRVFIPKCLREVVLAQFHEGHPGICAMKSLVRSLIWYPGVDSDVERLVKMCPNCQVTQCKPPSRNVEWPVPARPWSRVHIDHFFYQQHVFLIAVDALSRYIECEIVKNVSVDETIDALRLIFSRNGLCDSIISDNAACFTAMQFKDFLTYNGIEHITPPACSPSSNGQAERGVRVIKDLLKKSRSGDSIKTTLAKILLYYRSVPHSVTQIPPCVSLNNRKYICKRDRVNPKYCASRKLSNISRRIPNFTEGCKVLALNLVQGPKWFTGTIVQRLGINVFNVLI